MANQVMRITLKAYDHQLIDQSAGKIHRDSKENRSTGEWSGSAADKERGCNNLKSCSQVQRSREQFEQRLIRDSSISQARARRQ